MDIPTISKEELQEKLKDPNVQILNVLSEDIYDRLHIAGSINIPLDELQEGRWEELDEDKEVVAYCYDEACQASPTATKFLQEKGFNVRDYEGGIDEWARAGLPVEGEESREEFLEE